MSVRAVGQNSTQSVTTPSAAQPADGASLAGELSKSMPRGKAFAELFSIQRSTQQMSFECEVLPDQTKARRN
jgi:hypothetical protein